MIDNNYNQKQMAQLLGKTENQLSNILNADANITIRSIGEILSKIEYLEDIHIHNLVRPIDMKKNESNNFIVDMNEAQIGSVSNEEKLYVNSERD